MALSARSRRRTALPLNLLTLEDRAVPTVSFPDWTVGRYPFGWLGGEDVSRQDLPANRFLSNADGFMTGPQAGGRDALARQNLREFAGMLDLPSGDAADKFVRVTDSYADQVGSMQHVYLRQQVNGLPVLNSSLGAHYTADGRLSALGGGFFPGLTALDGSPVTVSVRPEVAVAEAAFQIGYDMTKPPEATARAAGPDRTTVLAAPEASDRPVTAKLAYVFSAAAGTARPVWHFDLRTPDGHFWNDFGVDTQTGEVLFSAPWQDNFGTYRALAAPNESPIDPSAGGQQTYEVNPGSTAGSPYGWHDTNGKAGDEYFDTRGNNVSAQLDLGSTNPTIATPTAGGNRPAGDGYNVYDNPYQVPGPQTTASQRAALVTQLFYANNYIHDTTAAYGFDEVSGNFQFTNYTGQGLGGDQVNADAQDGSGTDNANFATPPDGTSGRMQMYQFVSFGNPQTDSDYDNGIMYHEYGHGISNRLTGGPANASALNALQSGGMGEGWSDYWSLMLTQVPTDKAGDRYPLGTWVLNENPATGDGIRGAPYDSTGSPYSFDLTVNKMSFTQYGSANTGTEVHNTGARWCSALWDMNWLLINKYGYDQDLSTGYNPATLAGRAGNKLAIRLVLDGMKLQPANPSFTQARDAILQADQNLTGGVNRREIWTAFARRALGFSANAGTSNSTTITTATDLPAAAANPAVVSMTSPGKSSAAPTSVTLTFSEAMNTASFDVAGDVVSFTGPGGVDLRASITGFTWVNSTTLRIDFAPPAQRQGTYNLTVGPNILASDNNSPLDGNLNGTAGEAADGFAAVFGYDATQLAVTGITPAAGATVDPSLAAIDVTFNEAVDPASLSASDLQVSQGDGIVTGVSVLPDGKTARFAVAGLNEAVTYLQLKYDAARDPFGFASTTFRSSLNVDIVNAPFPTPLVSIGTLGNLGYTGTRPGGLIFGATDTDTFTLNLDPGQPLAVTVDQTTSLRSKLTVLDPTGATVGTATAAAAGKAVTVGGIVTVAGTYRFVVGGDGTTTGNYRVGVLLNAVAEAEAAGATNNTPATAQSLDAALVSVAGGGAVGNVIGQTDGVPPPVVAEAEPNGTTATATPLLPGLYPSPTSPVYLQQIAGNLVAGEADYYNFGPLQPGDLLTLALFGANSSGATAAYTLADSYFELYNSAGSLVTFNDDDGPGGFQSGIYRYSVPAADTYSLRLDGYGPTDAGTYLLTAQLEDGPATPAPATGGAAATDAEPNDTQATAVNASASWRRATNLALASGAASATTDVDIYSLPLSAGDVLSFRTTGTGTFRPRVDLLNPAGAVVFSDDGTSASAVTGLAPWLPAVPVGAAGTYFLQVRSSSGAAAYGVEVNLASATPPAPPPPPPPPVDYYSLTVGTGDVVSVGLNQPTGGVTTSVDLLDPAGVVVASTAPGATNYTRTIAGYAAASAGKYSVRVNDSNTGPTGVGYTLTVSRNALLEREGNDTPAAAQPTGLGTGQPRTVLGAVATAGDADYYMFAAAAGDTVRLRSSTPGDGPGEFVNLLDPRLRLYDPSGALVVTAAGNASDGRNSVINQVVTATGTYTLLVDRNPAGANGGVGPYAISASGASAGGPYTVAEGGGPLTFQAATFDLPGPLTFAWDFNNDGVYTDGAGQTVTLTWAQLQGFGLDDGPAAKPVRVRVTDGTGQTVTSPAGVVTITNTAPTASLPAVTLPEGGGPVSVTGAADPSAADTAAGFKYAFDFNNDGTFDSGDGTYAGGVAATATVPAVYAPDGPGSVTVKARVLDKDGGFTDYTRTMQVVNVAPTGTPGNDGAVPENTAGRVRVTAPVDPSPDDKTAGFRYSFDFDNDGTFDAGDGTYAGSGAGSLAAVPAKYLADGPAARTVRVRILDKDGGFTDLFTTIGVTNVAPTAKLASVLGPVPEGADGKVGFSGAADPSAADVAAGFKYSFDFNNDGVFDSGDGTYAGSGSAAVAAVPTAFLPDNGTFTVRGRVLDKDGGFTDYTTTVVVTNSNPTAAFDPVAPVDEGSGTTVTLSGAADPSPADTAAGFHYAFDFNGDGVFDSGDGTYAGSPAANTAAAAAKYFPDNGPVTVRGRILDKDGGSTDYTTTITVNNVAPTAQVQPVTPVPEGSAGSLTLFGAADPSPTDTARGFRYAVRLKSDPAWLVGDGTYAGSKLSPTAVLPATLFPDGPGTVGLVARVLDKDGGFTDYDVPVQVLNVAPTARLGSPGPVVEGQTGQVTFTAPSDPSAADTAAGFSYRFDFDNDGVFDTPAGPDATVTVPASYFADGGTGKSRTVRGRILDKDGGFTDYTVAIAVQNAPPTAKPANGGAVPEGSTGLVRLDNAADPSAADAASLRFSFDFDADGVFDSGDGTYAGSGTSPTAAVPANYLADGNSARSVRLRVIDKDGGFTDYTTVLPVLNVAPTATLLTPGPVAEGTSGSVSFAGTADPSPADTAAGFRYSYDFDNDGTFDLGGDTYATSVTAARATVDAKYLPEGPAVRTVRGRVYDKDGGFSEYTVALQVVNAAPTAAFGFVTAAGGPTVPEGTGATVRFTGAADPSPADTAAGFTYSFDFNNDGVFEVAGSRSPTAAVPAALLDNGPAPVTVRGRISDRDGGFTDYSVTIPVTNLPPTATPVFGPAVPIGSPSTLTLAGATDPSAGDTAAGFTYSFDFDGDGLFEVVGKSATATAVAAAPGTRRVNLRVTDRDGASTSYSGFLTVDNVAPTATFGPAGGPVSEGGTAAVRFTNPQQPSPAAVTAGFRYAFDLDNDGKFDSGDGTYAGSGTSPDFTLPAARTADAGRVTVRGRIIEVNGLSTDYVTTVEVLNVAPTATPQAPTPPAGGFRVGDPVTLALAQPADPSAADRAGLVYSFDFTGDGTFDAVGGSPAATATYSAPGSYTAVLRVADPKGAFTDYRVPVTVGAPPPPARVNKPTFYAVGSDAGGGSARLFDDFGTEAYSGRPFGDTFTGGVRVAVADVTGDGTPDLIAGTGPGSAPRVVVIDGRTRQPVLDVQPFEASFTGGVFVAAGDLDGDGKAEVVVTPDVGGGPVVAVYAAGGTQMGRFFGIEDPAFRGGARPAVADVDGDGKADLLVAAGVGGGPRLAGFRGTSLTGRTPEKLFADFFVFEQTLRNGVYVAAGDLNKDGSAEVVVGGGPGGGPRVMALDGAGLVAGRQSVVANFFAGDPGNRDGVRVGVADLDRDGDADVLAAAAQPGADGFRVRGYKSSDLLAGASPERFLLDPFPGEVGGVYVG